jgi:hypothetical protein
VSIRTITGTTQAADYLSHTYHWPLDHAERALEIAREMAPGPDAEPTDAGLVTITWTGGRTYTIEDVHQ